MRGYALDISSVLPALYVFNWEGAGNLFHYQIKLRISANTGDFENQETLPQICLNSPKRWGVAAGTKAVLPHGVQPKEGSPLWVISSVTITVN